MKNGGRAERSGGEKREMEERTMDKAEEKKRTKSSNGQRDRRSKKGTHKQMQPLPRKHFEVLKFSHRLP